LQQNDFFKRYDGKSPLQPVHSLPNVDNGKSGSTELQGLEEYKTILKNFYNSMFQMKFGAVVMNCNPFTLGHRYLIEQALKQCDYLMIFVVQEDKSFFSFDDRLKMVEDGTQDLKNVAVIPSGNFVLSAMTFSEYFNKEELQKRKVDTSLDVTLFAREIAPCLHISVRFAGEEPFDNITQQYNDSMRAILPQYGIDFVEIPRAEQNGVPISASHVRKLLEEKNFSSLSALVPQTTLEFLQKRFQ
jgi:[citrate (pro-3S)-lyase] ligase